MSKQNWSLPGLIKPHVEEKVDTTKLQNHIAFIVDSSGSMESIKDATLMNFNEQIQTVRSKSKEIPTTVTFVTFGCDAVTFHHFAKPADEIPELTKSTYKPDGSTPLFDAIGKTISKMTSELEDIDDENTSVLFIILTDGDENSSTEFKGEEGRLKLKELIEKLQNTNRWTFTFVGANTDVMSKVVNGLSFGHGNVSTFTADMSGVNLLRSEMSTGINTYFMARSVGHSNVDNFYSNSSDTDASTSSDNVDSNE